MPWTVQPVGSDVVGVGRRVVLHSGQNGIKGSQAVTHTWQPRGHTLAPDVISRGSGSEAIASGIVNIADGEAGTGNTH